MNVFSYIGSHDSGFAPNPFHGYCTLACYKPTIRRCASIGDWIVGLSPKRYGNEIVFAMKVADKLSFAEYWKDKRFRNKRAKMRSKDPIFRVGDNIYQPVKGGVLLQKPSRHSNEDGTEKARRKKHDLNGKFVMVSVHFSYFGGKTKKIPAKFADLIVTRGHKRFECKDEELQKGRGGFAGKLVRVFEKLPKGRQGYPRSWRVVQIDTAAASGRCTPRKPKPSQFSSKSCNIGC